MSVFDVRTDAVQKVTEISWCGADAWNLVKHSSAGLVFKDIKIGSTTSSPQSSLVANKEEAENLIKALQKAIELGWVK